MEKIPTSTLIPDLISPPVHLFQTVCLFRTSEYSENHFSAMHAPTQASAGQKNDFQSNQTKTFRIFNDNTISSSLVLFMSGFNPGLIQDCLQINPGLIPE